MKSVDRGQLLFMFADSPVRELGESGSSDKSEKKGYPKHIVKTSKPQRSAVVRESLSEIISHELRLIRAYVLLRYQSEEPDVWPTSPVL